MDYCDTGTATGWDLPEMLSGFSPSLFGGAGRKAPPQAFLYRRQKPIVIGGEVPSPASAPASDALPGEVMTEEVLENENQRRILIGIFGRFAAEDQISRATARAAEKLIDALPRDAVLPVVSLDGEGGVVMAWALPGRARTLATLADGVLWVVARAGTPQAEYLPETPFDGVLPDGLLPHIVA